MPQPKRVKKMDPALAKKCVNTIRVLVSTHDGNEKHDDDSWMFAAQFTLPPLH
jgi:hypothetical protein